MTASRKAAGKQKNESIPLNGLSLSVVRERVLRRDLRRAFANGAAVIATLYGSRRTYKARSSKDISYKELVGHT